MIIFGMEAEYLLDLIDAEIVRLKMVGIILEDKIPSPTRRRKSGPKPGSHHKKPTSQSPPYKTRHFSSESLARIGAVTRKRWNALKKAGVNAPHLAKLP
jgi:hypothetical protein